MKNIPLFYHFRLGDLVITSLSDGTTPVDTSAVMLNAGPGEVDRLLSDSFVNSDYEISINAFIFSLEGKLILVDTGAGDLMGPTAGHLQKSLNAAGFQAEDVQLVLLTHIHGDHSGGLLLNDEPAFPNAELLVSQFDLDYWLSEDEMNKIKPERRQSFRNAVKKLTPWLKAGKVRPFNQDHEILHGLHSLAQPGHTPGHTYYVVESKGEKLVFCADIVHVAEIQLANPEIALIMDVDPQASAKLRRKFLESAVGERFWMAADHINFPGIGHISKLENGFRWIPASYSVDHH